mmetsp:Transcript_42336/g.112014  ORF Transcript_42336/g.112014 Transcript_42336/m.112014 type:complete len:446 (-) Transcript_42336:1036-2373(-)
MGGGGCAKRLRLDPPPAVACGATARCQTTSGPRIIGVVAIREVDHLLKVFVQLAPSLHHASGHAGAAPRQLGDERGDGGEEESHAQRSSDAQDCHPRAGPRHAGRDALPEGRVGLGLQDDLVRRVRHGTEGAGHDHGGDDGLARLEVGGEADLADGLPAGLEVRHVHLREVADGREGVHPLAHLICRDLVVGRDERREGRIRHETGPPALRRVGHVAAVQVRGVVGLGVERVGELVGAARGVHARVADAAVARRVGLVLDHDPVEVVLRAEPDAGVLEARPVEHLHLGGLLAEQGVVHGDAPGGPARVGAVGAELRPRLGALAPLRTNVGGVGPGHSVAVQRVVVRARSLHAHPVGHAARRARGVVEDVVARGDRRLEGVHQLQLSALQAVQVGGKVVIKAHLPVPNHKVPERAIVRGGEVARAVAPRLLLGLVLPALRQQASPH